RGRSRWATSAIPPTWPTWSPSCARRRPGTSPAHASTWMVACIEASEPSAIARKENPMAVTSTLRILDAAEALEQLRVLRRKQPVRYFAFYSSQLGGIVTDPALMVIPFDDHMVHRGHGIFDTAAIVNGKIYDLEAHLDRFLRSAALSKL